MSSVLGGKKETSAPSPWRKECYSPRALKLTSSPNIWEGSYTLNFFSRVSLTFHVISPLTRISYSLLSPTFKNIIIGRKLKDSLIFTKGRWNGDLKSLALPEVTVPVRVKRGLRTRPPVRDFPAPSATAGPLTLSVLLTARPLHSHAAHFPCLFLPINSPACPRGVDGRSLPPIGQEQ